MCVRMGAFTARWRGPQTLIAGDTIFECFLSPVLASLSLSERVRETVSERPIRCLRIHPMARHTTTSSSVQASQAPPPHTFSPPLPLHLAPHRSALPSSNAPQSPTASSASFSNRAALLRYAVSVSVPVFTALTPSSTPERLCISHTPLVHRAARSTTVALSRNSVHTPRLLPASTSSKQRRRI